jgi:hypothetical protein
LESTPLLLQLQELRYAKSLGPNKSKSTSISPRYAFSIIGMGHSKGILNQIENLCNFACIDWAVASAMIANGVVSIACINTSDLVDLEGIALF